MSNLSATDLFLLVKSLTQSEKRYFKIYASRHVIGGENNYVKLFDAIDAQNEYDENKILKEEAYIRQLPLLKTRLYKIVLESLEGYGAGVEYEIRSMLSQCDFLFKKGLFKQHEKLLNKAHVLADRYCKYNYVSDIAGMKMGIISKLSYDTDINGIESNWDTQQQALNNLINTNTYKKLYYEFAFYRRKAGMHPNKKHLGEVEALMSSPFIKDENKAITPESISYFHLIHENYCQARNNWGKAHIHAKKRIKVLQLHPQLIVDDPNSYISCLRNLLVQCGVLKRYKEAETYVDDLRISADKYDFKLNKRGRALAFIGIYEFEIDKYLFWGAFENGCKLIPELERGLNEFGDIITAGHRAYFYLNLSALCFGNNQFRQSLKWINAATAVQRSFIDDDIYCAALINYLVIHYELKNYETLPFVIRSTYRYLRKKKRLFGFERVVLDFIRKKIPTINNQKELIMAFKILKVEIVKIMKVSNEPQPLIFIDYVCWIESKIEKRSYTEIVKEKAKKVMKGKSSL